MSVLFQGDDDYYLCVINGKTVDVNPAYTTGRMHPETASPVMLVYVGFPGRRRRVPSFFTTS